MTDALFPLAGFFRAAKRSERGAVIRTMVDDGARLIDTAPSYGTAEDVVGNLFSTMGSRDRIFLATKVRVAGRDDTVAEMRHSLERLLLPVAAETGTAVLTALPFGRGRLFSAVRGKQLPEWAAEFAAKTWGQFFLKYLIAHPAVNCVIPGTDKPEYMADNLDAGRGRLPDAAMRRKMIEF